jgi:hypothetical protein
MAVALVGSFAGNKGDRISDLDLAAFVADDREAEFMAQAHEFLGAPEVLNVYGQDRVGQVCFRKYVYLDFSSCEFHAFNQRWPFKLRRPFISVWDPHDHLETLVVEEEPPRHETLVDCIKWLSRGRRPLAKDYLVKLAESIQAQKST